MYSQRQIDLARLSLYAYDYGINVLDITDRNRTGIPEGWTQVAFSENPVNGFQAYAFLNASRTELVVAFTGTRFEPKKPPDVDWHTNFNGGSGFSDTLQFGDAVAFFRDLMAMDEAVIPATAKEQVMFTGHSLGGGMALFMGAAFGQPALGFAPAPFEQKLLSPAALLELQGFYERGLPHADQFGDLIAAAQNAADTGENDGLVELVRDRESYLASLSIDHEIVTLYQRDELMFCLSGAAIGTALALYAPHLTLALTAGQAFIPDAADMYLGDQNMEWLTVSGLNLGFVPSHGMHWHLALMAHEGLREVIGQLPQLAPIVDGFGDNPYGEEQVLLLKLLNNHYGVRDGNSADYLIAPNAWLDRFVADAGVLADRVVGSTEPDAVAAALAVLANHYWRHPDGVATDPFFIGHDWGLSFRETASAIDEGWYLGAGKQLWAGILDDVPENDAAGAYGDGLDIWREVWQPASAALSWYLQFGDLRMMAAGGDDHEIFIGADQDDDQSGGAGNDLLVGNDGNDLLVGGAGDDVLIGGNGYDVYRYSSGDGRDLIIDIDRLGHLEINGVRLAQADTVLTRDGSRAWYNAELDVLLRFEPGQGTELAGPVGSLLVSGGGLGGDGNVIEIRNYQLAGNGAGSFGITFTDSDRLVLLPGTSTRNPFLDPSFQRPEDSGIDLDAGGMALVTLALNKVSSGTRAVTLQADSAAPIELLVNGEVRSFSGGAVTLQIPAGQSLLTFGIRQAPAVDGSASIMLSAAFADGAGPAHAITINSQDATDEETVRVQYDGTEGNDRFWLLNEPTAVQVYGEFGDDVLVGGAHDDVLAGGPGADGLTGAGGNDVLCADAVMSLEESLALNDDGTPAGINSQREVDVLSGFDGDDILTGSAEGDLLAGGRGADVLVGGAGGDLLLSSMMLSSYGDRLFRARLTPVHGDWITESGITVSALQSVTLTATVGNLGEYLPLDGIESSDLLYGGSGDDALYTSRGDDTLFGGSGDDLLVGNVGNDALYGGDGNDYLIGGRHSFLYVDAIWQGSYLMMKGVDDDNGDDLLDGGAGHDALFGRGGHDALLGGDGDDALYGDWLHADWWNAPADAVAGNDRLDGGAGMDRLVGGHGDDVLDGGDGDDLLIGDYDDTGDPRDGHDVLDGGDGNDRLWGNGGDDVLRGGAGNDLLGGGRGDDRLFGGDADDMLAGGAGNDQLHGGSSNDQLYGDEVDGAGRDVLFGDDGDDLLGGMGGDDILYGGNGNDQLHGDAADVAASLHGNDRLYGEAGNDYLVGYGGDDLLDGGDDDDWLYGMDGNDRLYGGAGRDYLDGGDGGDFLAGGDGDDVYFIGSDSGSKRIVDSEGTDMLVFGPGFELENLQFFPGSLGIRFAGSDVEVHIEGFDPRDLQSSSPVEFIAFQAVANGPLSVHAVDALVREKGFDIEGGYFAQGTALSDRLKLGDAGGVLFGDEGDDVLLGGAGNDVLHGGAGNDRLSGNGGDDTYCFSIGDGIDTFADAGSAGAGGGFDQLLFGAGIRVSDIQLDPLTEDGTLRARVGGNGDGFSIPDWTNTDATIEQWRFHDGTTLDRAAILHALANVAPVCAADVLAVSMTASGVVSGGAGNLLANDSDDRTAAAGLSVIGAADVLPPADGDTPVAVGDNRGRYGWLRLGADGNVEYVVDDGAAEVQAMASGDTLSDVFVYRISDNELLYSQTAGGTLTVTVTRTADASVPEPTPEPTPRPGKPSKPNPGHGIDPPRGRGRRPEIGPGAPGMAAAMVEVDGGGAAVSDWLQIPAVMHSGAFASASAAAAARLTLPVERLLSLP